MKNRTKALVPLVALAAVAAALLAVWHFSRPAPQAGEKGLTIVVVHGDGSERTFPLRTDAEYLADALLEGGIVSGEETPYGLFLTICDGETADPSREEWWRVSTRGEMLMVGVSDEMVTDGGVYELTLVTGYE